MLRRIRCQKEGEDAVSNVTEYLQRRLQNLVQCSLAHDVLALRHFNVVIRHDSKSSVDHIANHIKLHFSRDAMYENLEQTTEDHDKKRDLDSIRALNLVDVLTLRVYDPTFNSTCLQEYNEERDNIVNKMVKLPEDQRRDMTHTDFFKTLKKYFADLRNSPVLESAIAHFSAEIATTDNSTQNSSENSQIKEYLNEVKNYMNSCKNKSELTSEVKEFDELWNKIQVEGTNIKKLPKHQQTLDLFIRPVLEVAYFMLKSGKAVDDMEFKEKSIDFGLQGFCFVLENRDPTFFVACKVFVFELNVIPDMNDPAIYMHYDSCWNILHALADAGYRIPLLQFDVWKAVDKFLENDDHGTNEAKAYWAMLQFLETMLNMDPERCLPPEARNDDYYAHSVQIQQILYDFELEAEPEQKDLIKNIMTNPGVANEEYKKWFNEPMEWFSTSKYAPKTITAEEKDKEKIEGALIARNFSSMFRLIGTQFAKQFLKRCDQILHRKQDEGNYKLTRTKLSILKNIADVSKQDSELLLQLLTQAKTVHFGRNLLDKLNDAAIVFPELLLFLRSMSAAETKNFPVPNDAIIRLVNEPANNRQQSNIHQMSDILRNEHRKKRIRHFTAVRLLSYEKDITTKLIDSLCGGGGGIQISRDISSRGPLALQRALTGLHFLLMQGFDEEEREWSETQFFSRRSEICGMLSVHMANAAESISKNSEDLVSANIIIYGCRIISKMMKIYNSNHLYEQKFFHVNKKEECHDHPIFKRIISAIASVYNVLTRNVERESDFLDMEILSLLYNMATCTNLTKPEIAQKYGERVHGTIADINNSEGMTTIYGRDDFLKLDVNSAAMDTRFYIASHLLKSVLTDQSFQGLVNSLKEVTRKSIMFLQEEKAKEEEHLEWLRKQEIRRKHQARTETVQLQPYRPNPSLMLQEQAAVLSINTIYFVNSNSERISWEEYSDLYSHFRKKMIAEEARCLQLLGHNKWSSSREYFDALLKFCKKFPIKKPLNKTNAEVQRLNRLKGFHDFLVSDCQYSEMLINGIPHYSSALQDLKEKEDYVKNLAALLREQGSDEKFLMLESEFHRTEHTTSALREEVLPAPFFAPEIRGKISSLKIGEILQRRAHADPEVPRHSPFVLVRVEVCQNYYQAVFKGQSTIDEVITKLQETVPKITSLVINGEPIDVKKSLSDIGSYAISFSSA